MSTSFVLSGGSNLGATQVGMLKALFEAGVVPSSIVGTSVGAINAGSVAGNPTLEGVLALETLWRGLKRSSIFPFKPVRGFMGFIGRKDSLFSSTSLENILSNNITFDLIEDARIPLSVVATEIRTGEEIVFDSGPAIPRIMASAALPGIFPSVTIDGVALMDGAVADNTPISRPVLEGVDTIYVLSCGTACALQRSPRSSIGVMAQALSVLVQQRVWQDVVRYAGLCQLYVVPPLCPIQVNPLDFSRSGELIDAAYVSTKHWLDEGAPSAAAMLKPHTH